MSQPITLFEAQKRVYPRDIWGYYRKLKWLMTAILLAVYWVTPWVRWDRGPNAPDQAILIDMGGRRAYFFDLEIWPQEIFYFAGLLILAAVGLFFVTSLLGRVWCGYACPQTVWTDLFVKVEYFFQGDRNARMKLDQSPLSFNKVWRKAATHIIWVVIGLLTGGAWVLYFNDAPTLFDQMMRLNVPFATSLWIFGLTFSTYIMAGYAREQVCAYMCPYARFQSAMFDKDTLIISYDKARGEPRGSHKQGESWDNRGHCIDCNKCVAVCPTGIDIRNGLQMECIACGLCVDACNDVMEKIGLPGGLIRYDTENNQVARDVAKACGHVPAKDRLRIFRPRTYYYVVIVLLVGGVMLHSLLTRTAFDLHVLHDRNPLFVRLSAGDIRNSYTVKILNKSHDPHVFSLTIEGLSQPDIKIEGAGNPDAAHLPVAGDSVGTFRVLVNVPQDAVTFSRRDIIFHAVDASSGELATTSSMFVTGE